MHIPGKRSLDIRGRSFRRRSDIRTAAIKASRDTSMASQQLANRLWSMLQDSTARQPLNQRKARKARRARFAAGDRHAFA